MTLNWKYLTGGLALIGLVNLEGIYVGFKEGQTECIQEAAPQVYDITGDGLDDIVIKDPKTEDNSCLVNLGDGNYRKTSFKVDHHRYEFCIIPGVGQYNYLKNGEFDFYSPKP